MQRRAFSAPAVLAVPVLLGLVALATRPLASSSVPALTAPEWVGVAADTMLQTLVMVLLVAAVAAPIINVWAVLPLPRGSPPPRPGRRPIALAGRVRARSPRRGDRRIDRRTARRAGPAARRDRRLRAAGGRAGGDRTSPAPGRGAPGVYGPHPGRPPRRRRRLA